jgi:hypothetical protein
MLRKLKWQIPGEPRNNWCQGLVPGCGPAVEKHWHSGCALAEDYTFEVNYLFFMLTYIVLLLYISVNGFNTSLLCLRYLFLNTLLPLVDLESVINFTIPKLAYSLALSIVISTDLLHPEKISDLVYFAQITKISSTVLIQNYSCNFFEKCGNA